MEIKDKTKSIVLSDGEFFIDKIDGSLERADFLVPSGVAARYFLMVKSEGCDKDFLRSFFVEDGGELLVLRLFLGGIKSATFSFQIAKSAKLLSRSLAIGSASESFHLFSRYFFAGPDVFGRAQDNAVMSGSAAFFHKSEAELAATASGSDVRVDMSLFLEGESAKGEVLPGISVANGDVRAGHSAGTFRLDKEALFYLRSRGLSPDSARRLLAVSLGRSFLRGAGKEGLEEEIISMILKKYA